MSAVTYAISQDVFTIAPGYQRALIVATDLDNRGSDQALELALRAAEEKIKRTYTLELLLAEPRLVSWREKLRATGLNPSEFRPGHEALARRAVQGKQLPFISRLVAIGNIVSLSRLLPIGMHPLDTAKGRFDLRIASGSERFTPFGSEKKEQPKPGEIIFAEENEVATRAWVWRQSASSVSTPNTKAVVVNVDGLPPCDYEGVESAAAEIEAMMSKACGGRCTRYLLNGENPQVAFSF